MGLPSVRFGDLNMAAGFVMTAAFDVISNGRPTARVFDLMSPHPGIIPKHFHFPNPLIIGDISHIINGRPHAFFNLFEMLRHPMITASTNIITRGF